MQARLVKLIVQPVIVIDDGNQLEEVEVQAFAVPAREVPTFADEQLPQLLARVEEQIAQH